MIVAGSVLPTLSSAGGDGGGNAGNKPASTSRRSYSKMTAERLELERKKLRMQLENSKETIKDLKRDIERGRKNFRNDKAEVDRLALEIQQETDPKKKKSLKRQLRNANRELKYEKFVMGQDITALQREEDYLVRLDSDMKSVDKWIRHRKATGG